MSALYEEFDGKLDDGVVRIWRGDGGGEVELGSVNC